MSAYNLQLRSIRKSKGLTIGQLADLIGSTQKIVGNWERGTTEITLGDALRVCKALDCSIDELAGWETNDSIKAKEEAYNAAAKKMQEAADIMRKGSQ